MIPRMTSDEPRPPVPPSCAGMKLEDPKGPMLSASGLFDSGLRTCIVHPWPERYGTKQRETVRICEVFQGTSDGRFSANPLILNSILLVRDEGVVGSNPITPTTFIAPADGAVTL